MLQKTNVGLYIGNDSVSVVEIKSIFGKAKVTKFACVGVALAEEKSSNMPNTGPDIEHRMSLISGGVDDVTLQKRNNIESNPIFDAVQMAFKESGIATQDVVTSLPAEEVMVRYFQMPYLPKREWDSGIRFEAKKYIPFKMEEVISDFIVTSADSKSGQMEVIFVAAKKESVEEHLQLLDQLKLKPVAIEMVAFSLARALGHQMSVEGATLLIELDTRFANVTIVRNNVPFFTRDIPLSYKPRGDLDYSGMIGDTGHAMLQDKQDDALQPMYQNVLGEIRLSLDYYKKRFPTEKICKGIVVGDGEIEDWTQVLHNELGIEIEIGRPMGFLSQEGSFSPRLAVAGGLALRSISQESFHINLSQFDHGLWRKEMLLPRLMVAESIVACILLVGIHLYTGRELTAVHNDLKSQHAQLVGAGADFAVLNSIDAFVERKALLQKKILRMINIDKNRFLLTDGINALSEIVPEEAWVSYLNFLNMREKGRRFTIRGYAHAGDKGQELDLVNTLLNDVKESFMKSSPFTEFKLSGVEQNKIRDTETTEFELYLSDQGV